MNEYIVLGKIVNTFGIKGEVKILSDFEYKDRLFIPGKNLYIGEEKKEERVNTYRIHKNFDLLTFKGYTNINEILKYKGKFIYFKRCDLELKENEYLLNDLIGLEVYDEKNLILTYNLDRITGYYIKEVLVKERKIITNKGSDLII